MKKRALGVNQMVAHTGAVSQAIRLLRFWADDVSDEPRIIEAVKQSRECARDLAASVRRAKAKQSS